MEAPHLRRLHHQYFSKGLRIIGVTQMDPTVAQIRAFLKRHGITYPIVRGLTEDAVPLFGHFLKDYAPHPW